MAEDAFEIMYQDNSAVSGSYVNDTVNIGDTAIKGLTLGIASSADRPLGIMGIGYALGESIVQNQDFEPYPNIIDQLKAQDLISTNAYSLWLNDLESDTGSILFSGVDTTKYTGSLTALPIQKDSNNSYSDFTVALTSLTFTDAKSNTPYAQTDLALPVILDSGTTFTYLPDTIANDLARGVGAIDDPIAGLVIPCKFATSKAKITFTFGNKDNGPAIAIPLDQFITPLTSPDGSTPKFRDGSGDVCAFGILPSGGPDQPLLLGDTFLRSAYVVYDLQNNEIAIAQTVFNVSKTDVREITDETDGNGDGKAGGIPNVRATASGVAVTQSYTGIPLQTAERTREGGARVTADVGRPTFDLGVEGAAGVGRVASVPGVLAAVGVVVVAGVVVGGGLVFW